MKKRFSRLRTRVGVSAGTALLFLYCLFDGQTDVLLLWLITSGIHESGHLIAARAMGIPLPFLRLDVCGARLSTGPSLCSYREEAVLCFAGPTANILSSGAAVLCGALFGFDPTGFVLYSFVPAFFNLLPLPTFDGGRIFACLISSYLLPEKAAAILEITGLVTLVGLWGFSVFLILKTGFLSALFVSSVCLFARLFVPDEVPTFSEDSRRKRRKRKYL